jgi:hypothetical protein
VLWQADSLEGGGEEDLRRMRECAERFSEDFSYKAISIQLYFTYVRFQGVGVKKCNII